MPSLGTLHHVDVFHRVKVASVRSGRCGRFFSSGSPNVCLSHVVIVWNGNHRASSEEFTKLQAEFKPAGGVLGMMVGLVAGEEQKIGILELDVFDDARSRTASAAGVAR